MKKICRHRVLIPSGDRVALVDHTHFVTHENGSLTIIGVSDMDSGPFVCWARNRLGSDLAYTHLYNSHPGNGARKFESQNFIFLLVISLSADGTGPPAIYHWTPLHVVSLPPSHTLTSSHLHCHAHGYPPPVISWSFLPLSPSLPPSLLPLSDSPSISQLWNGTLEFNPLQTAHTGLYRCEATNLFGTVSMETILFIEDAGNQVTHLLHHSILFHFAHSSR